LQGLPRLHECIPRRYAQRSRSPQVPTGSILTRGFRATINFVSSPWKTLIHVDLWCRNPKTSRAIKLPDDKLRLLHCKYLKYAYYTYIIPFCDAAKRQKFLGGTLSKQITAKYRYKHLFLVAVNSRNPPKIRLCNMLSTISFLGIIV
jgi:hypothetical protein